MAISYRMDEGTFILLGAAFFLICYTLTSGSGQVNFHQNKFAKLVLDAIWIKC